MSIRIIASGDSIDKLEDITLNTITNYGISNEITVEESVLEDRLIIGDSIDIKRLQDNSILVNGKESKLGSISNLYYWIDGVSYHKNFVDDMALLFTGNKDLGKYIVPSLLPIIPNTDYRLVWNVCRNKDNFTVFQRCDFLCNKELIGSLDGIELEVSCRCFPTLCKYIDKDDEDMHIVKSNNVYVCVDGNNLGYIDLYGLGIKYNDDEIIKIQEHFPITRAVRYDKLSMGAKYAIERFIGR